MVRLVMKDNCFMRWCCLLSCSGLFGLLMFLRCPIVAGENNLVLNGDFESGLEHWQVREDKPAANKVEIVPGPWGKSIRLTSSDKSGSTYATQDINPEQIKGRLLHVRAKVKAENVVVGTYFYSKALITMVWIGADGTEHIQNQEEAFTGTFDWKDINLAWNIGKDCVQARLYLGMHTTTGTVWFDNVSLSAPAQKSTRTLAKGVEEVILDNGDKFLRVDGREFTERKPVTAQLPFSATPAEQSQGFVVFQPEEPIDVVAGRQPNRAEVIRSLNLTAAPDQYELAFFALSALRYFKQVQVSVGDLVGPKGATIPASAFEIRMGRQVIQRIGYYTSGQYHIIPKLLVRAQKVALSPECPQLFWLTLHVPPDATPGNYQSTVTVQADGEKDVLPIYLRVLPFQLAKSKPWMLFFYDPPNFKTDTLFRDMREHGMTSVILGGINAPAPLRREGDRAVMDFAASDALMSAYRKAGFTDPMPYCPLLGSEKGRLGTQLLELWGLDPKVKEGEYPTALQEVYKQVIRDICEHARQANWPPILFYLVDEPNDLKNPLATAARLEYRMTKEAVPSARTFCTAYDIPTMKNLDPWLDVRPAIITAEIAQTAEKNKAFQDYLRQAGGEIWGIGWPTMQDDFWQAREMAGFLPAKTGVTGMTAWAYYYPWPFTDEYTDLRGEYKNSLFSYWDTDDSLNPTTAWEGNGSLNPTVTWEGIRAGINDWRYILTLKETIAKAKGAKQESASRVLQEALESIPWRSDPQKGWGNKKAQEIRTMVTEAILKYQ
ncbi:MAG: carbohydrate binding domain-containing protein [Candidatus Omnitrophota bacterium]